MVFSSIEFMFRFLPVFLIVYFAAVPKYRNIILLIGSLFFYGVGEPSYIILMIISILVNHFAAVNIFHAAKREDDSGTSTQTLRKAWLIAAMVFNFGMLFVFKYLNFFIGMINGIAHTTVLKPTDLTLPLGISFYTFQAASYVIDIYRRKYEIADGLLDFATYLCMFPQLIAGPIVSFAEVKDDLHKLRKASLPRIEWGTAIFVLGLAYKVLLANKIASLWNTIMTAGVMGIHPLTAWLGSWGFSMQLFFDFFGYSLM
ncbi:MAG: MBOAT family protein, partial [Clostridium sp.]|nr:MBOAT family protein [Clostridium sp.]